VPAGVLRRQACSKLLLVKIDSVWLLHLLNSTHAPQPREHGYLPRRRGMYARQAAALNGNPPPVMKVQESRRRLKKLLAEQMLDNAVLKDLVGKNF
jgi:hypothetical protein